MANKQKRTEVYNISLLNPNTKELVGNDLNLKEILESFFRSKYVDNTSASLVNTFKIRPNNLTYYIKKHDADIIDDIIKVKFSYVISNKRVDIVDASTLEKTGEKNKSEGDEEKQHIVIRTFTNSNQALLIFEKISGAINIPSLMAELNVHLNSYYNTNSLSYVPLISIKPTPSEDFLADLSSTTRISLVKIFADKNSVTNDPDLIMSNSNANVRDIAELVYKANLKQQIFKSDVSTLYQSHMANPRKIFRIVVEGNGERGKIKLDTHGGKMAKYISANLDIDGLVDTEDILNKFTTFVNTIPQYIINMCIDDSTDTLEE